jgi:hypothetical protein
MWTAAIELPKSRNFRYHLKIEARRKDLSNAWIRNPKETINDSINSLRWLRNITETTSRMGFNDIIFS